MKERENSSNNDLLLWLSPSESHVSETTQPPTRKWFGGGAISSHPQYKRNAKPVPDKASVLAKASGCIDGPSWTHCETCTIGNNGNLINQSINSLAWMNVIRVVFVLFFHFVVLMVSSMWEMYRSVHFWKSLVGAKFCLLPSSIGVGGSFEEDDNSNMATCSNCIQCQHHFQIIQSVVATWRLNCHPQKFAPVQDGILQ